MTLFLFFPLLVALVLCFVPGSRRQWIRLGANVALALSAAWAFALLARFDPNGDFQFVQRLVWIPSIGAEFHLAVDGYSLLLVAMTSLVGFLACLASWRAIDQHVKEFHILLLMLQTTVLGVFLSLDALLFFVFFEASLL
ncbi:MAG: Fe-S-binding domain-containing protein, partial [Acidobacteriota bacterium]